MSCKTFSFVLGDADVSHADKTQLWQDYAVIESYFCLMDFWDLAQSCWNIFYLETLKLL